MKTKAHKLKTYTLGLIVFAICLLHNTKTNAQAFSWFNGTSGQVWNASDANTGGRTYTLPSGLIVTMTIIDPSNRNCDPDLHNTNPFDPSGGCYPSTSELDVVAGDGSIRDPWDSDCDPVYTQTNGNYGLNYLTYGIKTATSAEEVTLRFTFSRPIYLNNFTVSDIDYYGLAYGFNNLTQYETPGNSFQDEVRFVARNAVANVPLTFSGVGSALSFNAATQTVKATYNTNADGNVLPTDLAGTVTVNAGATPITTLDIIYSNGPEDASAEQTNGAAYYNWWYSGHGATNGASDDQGIRIPGFDYTPCPVINFTANNITTCTGFPAIFSAFSPSGGTAPYTYKWLNPSGVQVSTSQFYTISSPTTAHSGDYTVVVTDANGCYATKTVTLAVNNATASTIGSNQIICSGGNPAAFTVTTAATGVGTLTYQWQRSTTGCSSGFSNISGATSATYDPPIGLTQTTYYRVIAISTLNSIPCTATSNCVTVTVYPKPSITALSSGFTECIGGTQTLSVTASGGTPPITYQWQNGGATGATWTNIGGATTAIYPPLSTTSGTTLYRVIVASSAGTACDTLISSNITVIIVNDPIVSVTTIPTTVCVGASVSLTATTTVGVGTCNIQWQSSPDGTTWTNISGATSNTYNVANLAATIRYRTQLLSCTGNGCCN